MTVEDRYVIDSVGFMRDTGRRSMMISDHLPWDEDLDRHLDALEMKIADYVRFIREGRLNEMYPDKIDRPIEIDLIHEHEPTPAAQEFLDLAKKGLGDIGIHFVHRGLPEGY